MIKKIIIYFITGLGLLMIVLSGLSLIHDISYWYAKVLDFPRLQYLLILLFCLFLLPFLKRRWGLGSGLLVIGLVLSIVIHSVKIVPYLFGEKVVPDAEQNDTGDSSVKILIANVLITNRNSEKFLSLIESHDPDVVLAMEVNEWWVEQLKVLRVNFPYRMEYPLDNAYGMAMYSKMNLTDPKIKFLKHPDVPSFHTIMTLSSGQQFAFHAVHPVAPFPSEKYPDNVGEEEVALAKVGRLVARDRFPSIVAGDFNDVSWSRTTRFFEKEGNLKNVRLGRGLYNTFNAHSMIMRWPLDHFFVTEEFGLKELKKLDNFESDHFAMLAEFVLSTPDP